MITPSQLRDLIAHPVLQFLDGAQCAIPFRTEALQLLMGTAMQESQCGTYLHQLNGPALGVWQMEPATEKDIWTNFLDFHPSMRMAVSKLIVPGTDRTGQLVGNLYYGAAMARVRYARAPEPLPAPGDIAAQAAYYVKNYNAGGAATVAEYMANWEKLVAAGGAA